MVKIGIIGGSGMDDPDIIKDVSEKCVETKFGIPSSNLIIGKIENVDVVIIGRHGKNHQFSPTQVNYRANIQALRDEGCTHIIATTAVGSLKKDIGRGDLILLDQFIDFTKYRKNTFHDSFKESVEHPAMAEPFDRNLRKLLAKTVTNFGFKLHERGTVITIEGPRFSTKAESKMFSSWGADVINMSVATEASLANEAKIPYAVIALSTDYDCLFDDIPSVTWEEILGVFKQNIEKVKKVLLKTIPLIET